MIEVTINKPLFGNYVYIRSLYINKAIKLGVKMKINIPNGSAIVDPREWKKNGKVMKKVFKRPDQPMILYGGFVPLPSEKGKIEVVEQASNVSLF